MQPRKTTSTPSTDRRSLPQAAASTDPAYLPPPLIAPRATLSSDDLLLRLTLLPERERHICLAVLASAIAETEHTVIEHQRLLARARRGRA